MIVYDRLTDWKDMLADCPDFQIQKYKVNPYLKVAIRLQNMGQEQAIHTLKNLAEDHDNDNKIIVLCRMLFEKGNESEFRRPLIGKATFPGGTDSSDWPLEPIEIMNGIPFIIARGYSVAGIPETGSHYLEYCITNCTWRIELYELGSNAEKHIAVNLLIASPKWKKQLSEEEIKWFFSQITNQG